MTDAKLLQMFHEADKSTQGAIIELLEADVLGHFTLKETIDRKGHTEDEVAAALGITPRTFKRKARTADFNLSQIQTMTKLLDLSGNEVESIFFHDFESATA